MLQFLLLQFLSDRIITKFVFLGVSQIHAYLSFIYL